MARDRPHRNTSDMGYALRAPLERIPDHGWHTSPGRSTRKSSTNSADDVLPANLRRVVSEPMRFGCYAAAIMAAVFIVVIASDRWLRTATSRSIPSPPSTMAGLFADPVPISITVSGAGLRASWNATEQDLRGSVELWKRMHLEDWNEVPAPLRAAALDNMLRRYAPLLNSPATWDTMTASDWDTVPQPIRTVAYRRMVAYWSGFYDVGSAFNVSPPTAAETLAAIVMSESWFDHRARSLNRDGSWDVGLAQASLFARNRLRELHATGQVDAALSETDYDNPWMATRFVALWMNLMLDESNGDLERAVRAYNRGIVDADDRLGASYFGLVQQRLSRYIQNVDAPPSWDYVWRQARLIVRTSTVGKHEQRVP